MRLIILLALALGCLSASAAKVERHCTTHRNAQGVLVKTCKGKVSTKHGKVVTNKVVTKKNCKQVLNADGQQVTECATKAVKVYKPVKKIQ